MSPVRRLALLTLCLIATVAAYPSAALAEERPNSMRLFPGRAVFFARTPDAAELVDRYTSGTGGKMLADPEIAAFLKALFSRIDADFREGPGKVTGGGLADFLALFEGEVALGVVPRRNEFAGLVFLADTVSGVNRSAGDSQALTEGQARADQLIASIKAFAPQEDWQLAEEMIAGETVTIVRPDNNARRAFGFLQRDGVLLMVNDPLLLESVLLKWNEAEGKPVAPAHEAVAEERPADDEDTAKRAARLRRQYAEALADNEGFTESVRECVSERIGGGDESPPQLVAFLDPVGIFKAIAQENAGARLALATLPILGLDGVQGAAAVAWINEGDWDALFRAHLLLDNPRAGVLKIARLAPCDPLPGDAIPAELSSYTCGAADFAAMLTGAGQLYDRIRGDGRFATDAESKFQEKAGVAPLELLEHFTGRFVSIMAYGATPEGAAPRVNPERAVFLQGEDPEAALKALRSIFEKTGVKLDERVHGAASYLVFTDLEAMALKQREEGPRPGPPVVVTAMALIGDDLVFSETIELLHTLIDTHEGRGERLADHLPFRLTANRASRLGAGTVAAEEGRLLTYSDPVAQMKQWHVAGTSDASRAQLDRMAEFAPPMRWLRDALGEAGVPSVEAMTRYATPSGAALYDTPRGFRYVAFSFKPLEE